MGLNIKTQISGQQANSTLSYSFIYEPLKIHVGEETRAAIGSIGYSSGSTSVTGLGSLFTQELVVGQPISIDGNDYTIATIVNDSSVTLNTALTTSSLNSSMFIEGDINVKVIYADVTRIDTQTGIAEAIRDEYIVRDISSLGSVNIDLSKVIRQLTDFDVMRISNPTDALNCWDAVVSKFIYKFEFYTDQSALRHTILKLPIMGGRSYENFVPAVDHNTPIRELSQAELETTKLGGEYLVNYQLKNITSVTNSDYSPTRNLSIVTATNDNTPCGGVIHWKSRLGGWMSWGMDLKTETKSHSYSGNLNVGMFESTIESGGGDPYIQVNYTGTSTGRKLSLKSLTRNKAELIALSEINGTPAVYFSNGYPKNWELMKLTSASAPIKTYIQGGDFSVSLSSISQTEQKVK